MRNIIFWSGVWPNFTYEKLPTIQRPMAAYALAHWMRKSRFQCQVIDFLQHFTAKEIIEFTEPLITKDTVCIALTTVFWNADSSYPPKSIMIAIQYFKKKFPNLPIVGGGPYSNNYKMLDHAFVGEGEDQFLKWCQERSMGVSLPNAVFDITQNDHTFHEDDCIMPDEAVPIELGRGCIFKCSFCTYPNLGKSKGSYIRKPEYLLNEMLRNRDVFGTTNYVFLDDTCNEDQDKITEIANINKQLDYKIRWSGFVRADLIWSHENHNLMLDSGVDQVYFGMESFHPEAARKVGKGWNAKHGKDYLPKLHNDLWKQQVGIEASFISGLPGEDIPHLRSTVDWIKENNFIRGYFRGLVILPKSEFANNPEKYFLKKKAYWKNSDDQSGDAEVMGWEDIRDPANNHVLHEALSHEFNDILQPTWPMTGFYTSSLYSLGYTKEEIKEYGWKDWAMLVMARKDPFITAYKEKLKTIINRGWR
jgi:radical SAM superfamily enzyme YgiQ (UPF0313 family)